MDRAPLASRLADRFRTPAVFAGWLAAALVPADLIGAAPGEVTASAAVAVGAAAVVLFVVAVCDPRFQKAVSALNVERRRLARAMGWRARLIGWGLPNGDGSLIVLRLVLFAELLAACAMAGHVAATSLAVAAFALTTLLTMALLAARLPSTEFKGLFT